MSIYDTSFLTFKSEICFKCPITEKETNIQCELNNFSLSQLLFRRSYDPNIKLTYEIYSCPECGKHHSIFLKEE